MSYRIASLNYYNFGLGNEKDIDILYKIIKDNHLDVVALQEIKNSNVLDRILLHLPRGWVGYHDSTGDFGSPNDFAYIWNSRRLRECSKSEYPEVFKHIKSENLSRKPYYARFTPAGLRGGPFIEFRLINIHIHFGSDCAVDTMKRKEEYVTLANEVYTRINKKRYGNNMPSYTVMLGDYNMTLDWCDRQNVENQSIQTFQRDLTTLKRKEDDFSKNYDHFTYDTKRFSSIKAEVSRINTVEAYFQGDVTKHREDVSDHVPIMIEIKLN